MVSSNGGYKKGQVCISICQEDKKRYRSSKARLLILLVPMLTKSKHKSAQNDKELVIHALINSSDL